MPNIKRYEQQFLDALKDIFIGAKVEGDSGYINLMRIKSRYYTEGVFPSLMKDIDAACKPFEKSFREELFDKLYDFFKRYFSESGSIYFRHTPQHDNVYEKVYTDKRDVMLFWKTHMLYYVKTDRLFNSMEVDIDGTLFYFDASKMEHKSSNEKRELYYTFEDYKDGKVVLSVAYSEKGRKTKSDEILRALKAKAVVIDEDVLLCAGRVFEKQSEVDYFINKNAQAFLKEQFDLWMYQYIFSAQSDFDEKRLKQLQTIKRIANNIIDFIAQFEDELVRVWNKPKFVLNSHYVITLDKITKPELRKKLFDHPGMKTQVQEWRELGMVTKDFETGMLFPKNDLQKPANSQYQFLPLDTRHFSDLELDILALFEDLDTALDGWLIHSENYQALNTLLPKFLKRVKCIHIDPPYNTDSSGFLYANAYQHSSWLSMMENRISIARMYMDEDGSFLSHVDENEYDHLYTYFRSQDFNYLGTLIWDKRNPMMGGKGLGIQHEYVIFASAEAKPFGAKSENIQKMLDKAKSIITEYGGVTEASRKDFKNWVQNQKEFSGGDRAYTYLEDDGRVYRLAAMTWPNPNPAPAQFFVPLIHPITGKPCPVPSRGWSRSPKKMKELIDKNELVFGKDETTQPQRKIFLPLHARMPISSVIYNGKKGKQELERLGFAFSYAHPVSLYEQLIDSTMNTETGITLDYFAGSGTAAHAVINLNRNDKNNNKRKYILIEMGEHFDSVMLPRVKKVVFSDNWKEGIAQQGDGISHFCKYYELEQYEEALHRSSYQDSDMFAAADAYNSYVFMRDLKMLDSIILDKAKNKVNVHLDKLYHGIDLAETISCITGKGIKRITKENVEFQDGTSASLINPDWELIKPLVWW